METKKRKVQFSGTKKVKKFVKGDYEDGSDLERSDEEVDSKEKIKHTLDSDEEDDSGKFKLLNQECLHGRNFKMFKVFIQSFELIAPKLFHRHWAGGQNQRI